MKTTFSYFDSIRNQMQFDAYEKIWPVWKLKVHKMRLRANEEVAKNKKASNKNIKSQTKESLKC
jgi:hypothetical protein